MTHEYAVEKIHFLEYSRLNRQSQAHVIHHPVRAHCTANKVAESSPLWAGKSPITSTLIAIQPECPQVIFQDLKEVHDHGEGKVNICLVKKCGLMRIMFLLGLFMITIFMWKFLFKTASLYLPPLSRIQL